VYSVAQRHRLPYIHIALLAPVAIVFIAFWLIPAFNLVLLPFTRLGLTDGFARYFQVVGDVRYLQALFNTFALSMGVTIVAVVLAACVGFYVSRYCDGRKRAWLLAILTLPLSFPGVIIGFYIILLGGRQGVVADLSELFGRERVTFAYGSIGLFLGYVYFSLPRAIASFAAASDALDKALEEAATMLGASKWRVLSDVIVPGLRDTALASSAIIFATAMGAFGTAFTLSAKFEVLPITIYNEFTNYANFATAAILSLLLGAITWALLLLARRATSTNTSTI
jgi:putative spermidine/putrescine transport system permease protein